MKISLKISKLLIKAKILEYGNFKGSYIWSEYAYLWMNKIKKKYEKIFYDHEIILIPALSNPELLKYQHMLVEDKFDENIYSLQDGGYLKPTSELILYDSTYFRNLIKSSKKLPIKLYTCNRVYRKQSRTIPFIRVNEIMYFMEAHSVFSSEQEASLHFKDTCTRYKRFFEQIGLPVIELQRLPQDRFKGAVCTYAYDTIFSNGYRLQVGTVHNLSTNYAKILDLKSKNNNNVITEVYQVCYGISERVLGALLYHGYSEKGFTLPKFLRLTELIVYEECYKEQYCHQYDKVHIIKESGFRAVYECAKLRDSIIYIIKTADNIEGYVRIIDRNFEDTFAQSDAFLYNSENIHIPFKLGPITHKILNKQISTWPTVVPKWGLSNGYIYGGPTY